MLPELEAHYQLLQKWNQKLNLTSEESLERHYGESLFLAERLPPGTLRIVDIGSGAGMDCLLAGRRVGPAGTVVGVDMTDEMLERARAGANEAGLHHVRFEKADINTLPIDSGSVDVVISNGVINLATDKASLFSELYRVVRPGGRMQFADIIVGMELSEGARNDIDLWTG